MITKIDNHLEQILKNLLEQYKEKPNLINFIEIFANQVQELEDAIEPLCEVLDITLSEGQQLDEIGDLVVQDRLGNTDPKYRILLRTKIGINTSKGEGPKVIEIVKVLTESDYVHLINLGGGAIDLEITTLYTDQTEINFIFENIQKLVAAGVRVDDLRCVSSDCAFSFADGPFDPPSKGFEEGYFATVHRHILPFSFAAEGAEDPQVSGFGAGFDDPLVGGQFII